MSTNSTDSSTGDLSTGITNLMEQDPRPWENADPFVSAHTRYIVKIVLDCYVQQFICLLGIPGNMICCMVFLKQGLSDRINLLLFGLAVADLINLLTLFLIQFNCYIENWDSVHDANWSTMVNAKISYVSVWSNFLTGGLIVVMSVDRCLSVVMPLKAGRLLSYRSMLVAIIVTYLGSLVLHLPIMLAYTIEWRMDPLTNRSNAHIVITDWFVLDIKIAHDIRTVIGMVFKPAFAVVVISSCIITIAKLRQASRKRLQMQETGKQENGRRDNQITKMLLLLCAIYVVLFLPDVALKIASYHAPEFFVYQKYHNTFLVIVGVLFTASCLNSTANFFTYLVLSTKFRKTLRELCQCCGGKSSSWVRQRQEKQTTHSNRSKSLSVTDSAH